MLAANSWFLIALFLIWGLIFLPNEEEYERAKLLRWFGIDREKRNYKGKDIRHTKPEDILKVDLNN